MAAFEQRRGAKKAVVHSADYALALLDAPEPLQVRVQVLNEDWRQVFQGWYPRFEAEAARQRPAA